MTESTGVFAFSDAELQRSRRSSHCSPPSADVVEAEKLKYLFSVKHSASITSVAKELRRDVVAALARARDPSDLSELALLLAQRGWQVWVRGGVTSRQGARDGSATPQLFKQLRHSFLLVESGVPGATAPILVDPSFREQFALGATTPAYDALLAAIPRLYVGCVNVLKELVPLMAARVAQALASSGLPLPPWRDAEALLSLWMPAQYRDRYPAKDTDSKASGGNVSSIGGSSSTALLAPAAATAGAAAGGRVVQAAAAVPTLARRSASLRLQKAAKSVPKQIVLGFAVASSGDSSTSHSSMISSSASAQQHQQQQQGPEMLDDTALVRDGSVRHNSASSLVDAKAGTKTSGTACASKAAAAAPPAKLHRVGSSQRGFDQLQQLQKRSMPSLRVAAC